MIGNMDIFRKLFGLQQAEPPAPIPLDCAASPGYPDAWRKVQIANLREAHALDDLRRYLRSSDGFVRQAAVEHCARLDLPGLMELLIERLNDWVPQVRRAAQRALDDNLAHAAGAHIVAALPAVYRLEQARRAGHAAWIAGFEQAALARAGEDALLAALGQADVHVARAAFRLLAQSGQPGAAVLFCQVIPASHDVVLASLAFDHLDHSAAGIDEAMLTRAMASRLTSVRVRALERLLATGAPELAAQALFARQSQVRAVARRSLARQGSDVASLYAGALQAPGQPRWKTVACLFELGQLRQPAWLGEVRVFLAHAAPAVREAAALAWLSLVPAARDEIALFALSDSSPRLHGLALRLVRRQGAYLPFAAVRDLLRAPEHRDSLLAFAAGDPWDWLETIASPAQGDETAPQRIVRMRAELAAWSRASVSVYTRPTPAQRACIAPMAAELLALAEGESWRGNLVHALEHNGLLA